MRRNSNIDVTRTVSHSLDGIMPKSAERISIFGFSLEEAQMLLRLLDDGSRIRDLVPPDLDVLRTRLRVRLNEERPAMRRVV